MQTTTTTMSEERARPQRGMKLGSMMVVIAVIALCLTIPKPRADLVLERIDATLPLLAGGSVALIAVRLRRPHPALARLASQPGILACGVASVLVVGAAGSSLLLGLLWTTLQGASAPPSSLFGSLFQSLTDWGYLVGLAVMVSWIVLGVVRGWRAEANAYDRVGRAIGWAWILLAPAGIALRFTTLIGQLTGL